MIKSSFTEMPNKYSYFPLNNGLADVFVRIFDHEEMDEDGNVLYICNTNEFRINQDTITEEMVASNPEKYLNYSIPESITEMERLEAVEAAVLDLAEVIFNG